MERELTIKDALDLAVKNHTAGRLKEAEKIYRRIIEKYPDNPDALHLLGLIAHQAGEYEVAVEHIKRAIEFRPGSALFHGNLGMAYDRLGKEKESAECFQSALKLNPLYKGAHLAHYNLGVYFRGQGRMMEALEHYDKAIEIDKELFDARWNRSFILLLLGRFKEGFEDYECRLKKKEPIDSRVFGKLKWQGEELNGKRILVVSEQGFGDDIQFVRYISLINSRENLPLLNGSKSVEIFPDLPKPQNKPRLLSRGKRKGFVIERGGHVVLECKKELRKLFEGISNIDEFVERDGSKAPDVEFDFYIHLMSLPYVFGTELESIPGKVPYLKADERVIEKFREKIKSDKFKIGIVWAGNPKQENDKNRSMTFDKFKSLKEIPGIELYSLQKGEAAAQLNDSQVIDMGSEISDFADTAAIIENLDLVISVDTCVAHLAGAMGKPAWTLLTFMPDWRWLLNREDCPWYPSMKLFRQTKEGDWNSVFEKVKEELQNYRSS